MLRHKLSEGDKMMFASTIATAVATIIVWYTIRGKRVL